MMPAADHAADQGPREGLGRVDRLLGDVGGVLESGHGEEGQRDAGDDGEDRIALGVELGQHAEVGVALGR